MLNKAMIIGHLGKDPESKTTQAGMAISNFSVATSEKYKDTENTEWHNIVAFGKTAEFCNTYLRKGAKVYVEGKIKTDSWEDQQGNKKYSTKIYADRVQSLGGKSEPIQGEVILGNNNLNTDESIPF